jgi:hypothetical protein
MRDNHDRATGIIERVEQLHDLDAGGRVEVAGRFVGEQERGIVDQRPGDRYPLLLTAG